MRKNQIKFMAAGMIALAFLAGCGSKDSDIQEEPGRDISAAVEDAGHSAKEQESQTDTQAGKVESGGQPQSPDPGDIEKELAAYRAEREQGESSLGNEVMVVLPNEENYKYGVGESHTGGRFDSRELNLAFKAAMDYVEGTLGLESEVWECCDPRMNAIYEDEDKGVANGYEAGDIFLCEYEEDGKWQYLILVREGKGSDWEVLYHGGSYKTD